MIQLKNLCLRNGSFELNDLSVSTGDGSPNSADTDDDNDGLLDMWDPDDDNDGIPDLLFIFLLKKSPIKRDA